MAFCFYVNLRLRFVNDSEGLDDQDFIGFGTPLDSVDRFQPPLFLAIFGVEGRVSHIICIGPVILDKTS